MLREDEALSRRAQIIGSLALTCVASRANAEEIGIVAIGSNVDVEVVRGVRAVIEREVLANTALDLAPRESVAGEMTQGALRACAGDAECFAALVGRGVAHVLVLSLGKIEGNFILGLRWIELDRAQAVERGLEARTIASAPQLESEAVSALAAVFGARWGESGALVVRAEPPDAEITVGASVCLSPCQMERMKAGTYSVGVRAPGFVGERVDVVVRRGETTTVPISLDRGAEGLSPWVWIAGSGVVVGAALTAILIATSASPTKLCLKDPAAVCPP